MTQKEVAPFLDKFGLQKECNDVLSKVHFFSVSSSDSEMENFVRLYSVQISNSSVARLSKIKKDLDLLLRCLESSELLKEINKSLTRYRKESKSFFSIGMNAKAKRIEDALQAIPIKKRVFNFAEKGEEYEKVRESLASHRYFGKSGKVYKKEGKIDYSSAANTYKKLYNFFVPVSKEEHSTANRNGYTIV